MEWMFLGMVVFLFILAAFDLYVGVSNDAVNFLNSAIGSRAARFRTLLIIASAGVFLGCALSNGMMDIARHGIFTPSAFTFREVMLIYMAVMVTDIVLLDVFNSFGMPTSTTVSMVFELLGAAFAFVMIKMAGEGAIMAGEYLNTSKALEVIMGIFLSVPIAFVVGSFVQYVTRVLFSFNLRTRLTWKIGLFGGIALTAIIYFMLFKGLKDLSFMSPDVKAYLNEHILLLLGCCFVVFTVLMQLLHAFRVNVFRVVVLCGTFALAMAFAGNDLVNFIGVPLAGFSAYNDYAANGLSAGPDGFMMDSLMGSAQTPIYFLVAAGAVMVFSLATSKKARNVVKTEVGLASSSEGDEMFGSSRVARSLVRWGNSVSQFFVNHTPERLRAAVDRRFVRPAEAANDGAAYDMLRASVNLVVASLLIALGTSLKLPLSTTFVTFMVAMGTSLADRAWNRETAVFRITGVLTVIGGWFITAGVAFTACFFVALAMNYGGVTAVVLIVAAGIYALIHSQRRYARKQREEQQGGDVLFREMLAATDPEAVNSMLRRHLNVSTGETISAYADLLADTTEGLFRENRRQLHRAARALQLGKRELKNLRRREMICLRRTEPANAVRLSTTFHLVHNSMRQMLYGLLRINEPACEHVDNRFTPPSAADSKRFCELRARLIAVMRTAAENLRDLRPADNDALRDQLTSIREQLVALRHDIIIDMQTTGANLNTTTLMLHVVQETEQVCVEMRRMVKNIRRFNEN